MVTIFSFDHMTGENREFVLLFCRRLINNTVVLLHLVVAEMFLYIWTSKQTNPQARILTVLLPIFSLSVDCTSDQYLHVFIEPMYV